jgi:hypothetical protein
MAEAPYRVSDPTLAELLRRLVPAYRPERVYLFMALHYEPFRAGVGAPLSLRAAGFPLFAVKIRKGAELLYQDEFSVSCYTPPARPPPRPE